MRHEHMKQIEEKIHKEQIKLVIITYITKKFIRFSQYYLIDFRKKKLFLLIYGIKIFKPKKIKKIEMLKHKLKKIEGSLKYSKNKCLF
jgi:hypothetical protein